MRSPLFHLSVIGIHALLASSAASAQTLPASTDPMVLGDIVVRGLPLGRTADEMAAPITIIQGDELIHRRRGTVGDTLDGEPGIRSDTFGAGASRPVIRGQTAPRVRVLSDGSELMDASAVSPDHAIATEPLLLERIEVLRGPSALFYGGAAIGGAVNLIDKRVPTALPEGGIEGAAELRGATADTERSGAAGFTAGAGNFAFRLEGSSRRSDDYRIPDRPERRVEGSYHDGSTASAGLSWVGRNGFFGAAYTRQRSEYGLPGHSHEHEGCHLHGAELHCGEHDHDDDHDHGIPFVDLRSDRFDIRGEYRDPLPAIENIRLRAGITDYEHDEIDHGVVGTTFRNKGYDFRLEIGHAPIGRWRGVAGVQSGRSEFSAVGVESFIPETTTRSMGVFLLEEYRAENWRLELAVRQEWQDIDVEPPHSWVKHRLFSASGALTWDLTEDLSLALSLARSQRAPTPQELYADGVHLATNTFELGNPALEQETSQFVDLTLRGAVDDLSFSVSLYQNAVDDYIFAQTLDQQGDFRFIRYEQQDARFTGVDAQVGYAITDHIRAAVYGDYVRGRLSGGAGYLPRIPAARAGVRVDIARERLSTNLDYYRSFEQDDIAAFETNTAAYDMLNVTVAYNLGGSRISRQIYLRGTNLLDELALNHTSFIKDVAPLMGRNFVLGLRANF